MGMGALSHLATLYRFLYQDHAMPMHLSGFLNKGAALARDGEPFDQKQAEFIRIIAEGGTWRSAAAELKTSQATFSKWLQEDEALEKQYARALEAQGDDYAFKVIETVERTDIDASEKRVRVDAYKWAAGKRKPKVYGDKLELSGDEKSPLTVNVLTHFKVGD